MGLFGSSEGTAYCVKCRKKVTPKKMTKTKVKGNRYMMKGVCPKCGTKVSRFMAKKKD